MINIFFSWLLWLVKLTQHLLGLGRSDFWWRFKNIFHTMLFPHFIVLFSHTSSWKLRFFKKHKTPWNNFPKQKQLPDFSTPLAFHGKQELGSVSVDNGLYCNLWYGHSEYIPCYFPMESCCDFKKLMPYVNDRISHSRLHVKIVSSDRYLYFFIQLTFLPWSKLQ